MTAASGAGGGAAGPVAGGGAGRRVGPIVLLAVLLLGVAALAGQPPTSRPLDPRSTRPDGARGLVLLLEALGADVEVVRGAPPPAATAALVLRDRLNPADTRAALDWADAGGVLVVADPGSSLAGEAGDERPCPAPLDDVGALEVPGNERIRRGEACFDGSIRIDDRGEGGGAVVVVDFVSFDFRAGGNAQSLFMNELLDEADNAVLAAVLLAPTDGARVAILEASPGGTGETTLLDLLDTPLRQALIQLLVVAGVFVLWRARRLGRPVVETQAVAVAGSELVVAVGRLLDARRRPDEAAVTLRADLRRALEARLSVPVDAPIDAAAAAVVARTGLPAADIARALDTTLVTTDADLVAVTAQLDRIRQLAFGSTPDPRRNP